MATIISNQYTLNLTEGEMALIAKLLSHVRLGGQSPIAEDAYSIISEIENSGFDFDTSAEIYLTASVENENGELVASIYDHGLILEVS